MIYEIRTYQIAPGSLAEVEKRFGEAYEYRKKYSPLTAFWHTEVGPLNEIIHVWGYKDLAERAKVRAEAVQGRELAAEDQRVHPQDALGDRHRLRLRADAHARQDGPDLRDPLLHPQGRHAAGHGRRAGRPSCRTASSSRRSSWRAAWSSARPTGSCTSGRTRAWTSGCRFVTRRGRRACGRPVAAATV